MDKILNDIIKQKSNNRVDFTECIFKIFHGIQLSTYKPWGVSNWKVGRCTYVEGMRLLILIRTYVLTT